MSDLFPVVGRTGLFQRARRGLYGGKTLRYGNKIAPRGRKTRRRWLPNVQNKTFKSDILDEKLRVRCTTSVIKKVRRLDNSFDKYLLHTADKILLYPRAIDMKYRILAILDYRNTQKGLLVLKQMQEEAKADAAVGGSSPSTISAPGVVSGGDVNHSSDGQSPSASSTAAEHTSSFVKFTSSSESVGLASLLDRNSNPGNMVFATMPSSSSSSKTALS
eukprot:CAMPEP_0184693620 /NCGR_PEP_ID=MMETSP0313-20130426/1798_1 /TAXON_ID=2792 /ORGANISM="Porphyridium aerugineum, Strain SAG 1380-2" /LENGTH=217 /DNA_ID=CAMNT_0027151743 /DNA_START=24 /DNA_END=677 /DNA_ORIENTATION=+